MEWARAPQCRPMEAHRRRDGRGQRAASAPSADYGRQCAGVAAEVCDDIDVMYAGKLVEVGSVEEVFALGEDPKHSQKGFAARRLSIDVGIEDPKRGALL